MKGWERGRRRRGKGEAGDKVCEIEPSRQERDGRRLAYDGDEATPGTE